MGSVLILSGCGADPSDVAGESGAAKRKANKITGSVSEWAVDVSAQIAEAGEVTFAITNFGTVPHEFLVTKTTFEPGAIPLGENNRFDEELEGISVIDEIPEFEVESTGLLKVMLEPGVYELLCNIEGHYAAGMYQSFEVVPATSPSAPPPMAVVDTVSNDIDGSVSEWEVKVGHTKANAGEVTFMITNEGTVEHEFLVVKTDYAPGMIPLGDNNRFDEELEGISVVDEIPEWPAGKSGELTVDLEPGLYQLLCNIEGHYKNGMYVGFEVV